MRSLFVAALCVVAGSTVLAQPRASVSYASFQANDQPYIELYITVERSSLTSLSGSQPGAEFTILFANDEGGIVAADKVRLLAPALDSTGNFVEALRYPLAFGEYELSVVGVDIAEPKGVELKLKSSIVVDFEPGTYSLSDIQLASNTRPTDDLTITSVLAKGDSFLEPLPQNFVRRGQKSFTAYVEAYTPEEFRGKWHLVEYTLLALPDGEEEPVELLRKTKRFAPEQEVTPFFFKFATNSLSSGNYALRMTLRDRSLQELSKRITLLTISNPDQDALTLAKPTEGIEDSWVQDLSADTLEYTLQAILPTLNGPSIEYVNEVLKNRNVESMRLAVYNHFVNESAVVPETAYSAYMKVAREVDYHFQSGFGRGFQTDRGYIYLKYGLPDDRVIVNDDPTAPPYEIWVYNFVERTGQSPGKFLFYNETLDNASYVLLHSTVRGEINEPQWRRYLYSRVASEFGDPDQVQGTDVGDNVGRYADQYFADF